MFIKGYIREHLFQLPTKDNAILEGRIEKKINEAINDRSEMGKVYPLTKIEGNENIVIEKQKTSIFLLNLLLSVLQHKDKAITVKENYDDTFIISQLEKETSLKLQDMSFSDLEKKVMEYLTPSIPSILENVEFNLAWVEKAHKESNGKG
ncbi:hypothetical protein [Bacillus toyonensis]|uniref:Uncharacterized protein n=1 Tax=Bacillus toyonensis TaxID=155322 RepID=A0A2A8HDE3_9BACI|nr:hypothetical protein [Bacillus toyonensis]PEQ04855.1 hypothetical protein CN585_16675 [Bacillus toyonensis]